VDRGLGHPEKYEVPYTVGTTVPDVDRVGVVVLMRPGLVEGPLQTVQTGLKNNKMLVLAGLTWVLVDPDLTQLRVLATGAD
jgi:hypothetical protein